RRYVRIVQQRSSLAKRWGPRILGVFPSAKYDRGCASPRPVLEGLVTEPLPRGDGDRRAELRSICLRATRSAELPVRQRISRLSYERAGSGHPRCEYFAATPGVEAEYTNPLTNWKNRRIS